MVVGVVAFCNIGEFEDGGAEGELGNLLVESIAGELEGGAVVADADAGFKTDAFGGGGGLAGVAGESP